MKNSKVLLSLLVSTAVLSLAAGTQAQAQSSEEGQSRYALEEITVTSRRVEEGLQQAPLAVTAISGIELENRGALDVIDFADVAPNVSMKTNGAVSGFAAAPRTAIRGIGQSDFVINTDPAVGLYADGVYLGRSIGSVLDLVDVERVEALRGPQGTLFGRNSTGGAINIISKKPEVGGALNGYATAAIGEDGYSLLRGSANIPVGDTAAVRVSAMKRNRDGFVPLLNPNYSGYELGAEDVLGVKAALRWEPRDNITLDLDADFSERSDSAAPIIAVALGDLSIGETGLDPNRPNATNGASTSQIARRFNGESAATGFGSPLNNSSSFATTNALCGTDLTVRDTSPDCLGNFYASSRDGSWATWFGPDGEQVNADDQSLETYGYSARLNWDFENFTVNTISAWRGFDASFLNGSPAPVFTATNDNVLFEQDQMSHEITLSGDFNDSVSWLAGAFYQEEDGRETVEVRYPLTPPPTSRFGVLLPLANVGDRFVENTSKAIYGQISADITDKLELTLGARQTEETKEVLVNQITYSTFAAGNPTALTEAEALEGQVTVFTAPTREASEANFLANLSYDVTDDSMVYAQFSNGFRNGGFPARTPGGTSAADFTKFSYDEEFVDSYELGIKSKLLDGDLRLNAAAFLMDYTDMQINATAFLEAFGSNVGTVQNVGDSTIKGFELEGNFLATDNLRFDLSLGYLSTEITSVRPDENGLNQFIINSGNNLQKIITEDSNTQLPHAPKLQLSVGANYSFYLGNGAEIRNRADVLYESSQFSDIANYNIGRIPESTRINYNASYIPENADWEITLGARNLTNEEDISNIAVETGPRAGIYNVLARGREAYVQFKYSFGE